MFIFIVLKIYWKIPKIIWKTIDMTASYVTVSSININFIWRCNMEKDSLVGRKYGDLSTQMQEEVRRMIVGSYFGMNNGVELKAPIEAGQYDITVDLDNGLYR